MKIFLYFSTKKLKNQIYMNKLSFIDHHHKNGNLKTFKVLMGTLILFHTSFDENGNIIMIRDFLLNYEQYYENKKLEFEGKIF